MCEVEDYKRKIYEIYPPTYLIIYIGDQVMMQCGLCKGRFFSSFAFYRHWVLHIEIEEQSSKLFLSNLFYNVLYLIDSIP